MKKQAAFAAEILVLAALYVVAARAGLKLDAVGGFASLIWPPTGIALAALLIRGYRLWPGVAIGAFVANVLTGAPIPVALGITLGNTLEALAGAYALRQIPEFHRTLDRLIDAFALLVVAAVMSTAISATIGVLSLHLGGIISASELLETWRAWWLGDLIGNLLVAPVILVWSARVVTADREQWLEAGALGISIVAVSFVVFRSSAAASQGVFSDAYLFFPLLMWAAVRFGQRGSVTTAFIISAIAVWGTVLGRGPFVEADLHRSLFALQTFVAVTAATFLILGATVSERREAVERLNAAIEGEEQIVAERDAAHRRLLAILEQSPLAIGIAEAPSGRFLFLNDEFERITGMRPSLSRAADPDSGEWDSYRADGSNVGAEDLPLVRALRHGEVVRNEVVRLKRHDGRTVELMTNAAPVKDAGGNIVAAVMIFWDVTAQRKAEEELRRAHEAEAHANRAKSEFLTVMSHELRTPLNAIGGHIQLIEMGVHGPISEAQRDALERAQRSQRHLLALINDVLNLARIETGHVDYQLSEVPLETAVAEVKAMVEPLLSANRLHCELAGSPYAPDPPIVVRADREKLQQILFNLLSNAIKFTPAGGRITVEAVAADGEPMASVKVTDSGDGIPAAKLESIFEPFVQLGGRPATSAGGLGLGLSISRDLARGMGGDLKATSVPGGGATFTLSLPRA
ncbi:MAG TPA: MASE1 domain-containing protein [Gemmatimonadaceae bacterium]|nr:MASE1 domain-containing protein [Gemmatimonadaceae bacterium]